MVHQVVVILKIDVLNLKLFSNRGLKMKIMTLKKIIFTGLIGGLSLLNAYEPSVYGAGDINSATPYGLTQTEETVLDNKKTIQMLNNRLRELQRKMDGLSSIIEGQNKEVLALKEQLMMKDKDAQYEAERKQKDSNRTYSMLLELGQMIDNIHNTYVTKDELTQLLSGSRGAGSPVNANPISKNAADTYRNGVRLFQKRSYRAAGEHFSQTLADNYKPAASNYYLAEVAFYTYQYSDAVAYYKQSAALYDKASYMDTLYLHTAIALDKSGEKEQAQGFYQYVIDNFPRSRAAVIAKNRM